MPILDRGQAVGLGYSVPDEVRDCALVVRGQALKLAVDRRRDIDHASFRVALGPGHGEYSLDKGDAGGMLENGGGYVNGGSGRERAR